MDCTVSSRPHSESADHAVLELSMPWDAWECIERRMEATFSASGAGESV